jgi:hypothetical protein
MRESYLKAGEAGNRTETTTTTGEFEMTTTITRSFARYIALPAVSAGILGAAALGLAGMANAGTYSYEPTPRPGIVATPNTVARPPVVVMPGHRWHRHHGHVIDLPTGE